jgi:membrane dipeptidase
MYPNLFARLIETGWNDADLVKLAGGNIIRVLGDAEKVNIINQCILVKKS